MEELIAEKDFAVISKYIKTICGREIPFTKEYVIRQKLDSLLEKYSFQSFNSFALHLKAHNHIDFKDEIISAISVNETFFFRDEHPFVALEDYVLKEVFARKDYLNIWSAASSTGQEIYSVAMSIENFFERNPEYAEKEYHILATDIDKQVLEYARQGSYVEMEVNRGLSEEDLEKYFISSENKYIIKDDLKKNIEFSYFNILDIDDYPDSIYDIIYLRNLLIYFDADLKYKIVKSVGNKLQEKGYLILGAAESLFGMDVLFESLSTCETILYQKKA